jgi:hypothetical protein
MNSNLTTDYFSVEDRADSNFLVRSYCAVWEAKLCCQNELPKSYSLNKNLRRPSLDLAIRMNYPLQFLFLKRNASAER